MPDDTGVARCKCCNHKIGRDAVKRHVEDHSYVTQCPKCKRYLLVTFYADGRKPTTMVVDKNYEIRNISNKTTIRE